LLGGQEKSLSYPQKSRALGVPQYLRKKFKKLFHYRFKETGAEGLMMAVHPSDVDDMT
jgi:hypothetical protein